MTSTSVFALGRMRHLDLLAHYFQLHPATMERTGIRLGQASTGVLVKAITSGSAR